MTRTTGHGLHIFHDSGAPENVGDYSTLVFLHGNITHGGGFMKLVPPAKRENVRVVLVNRRDYLGTIPYTDEERALFTYPYSGPPLSPQEIQARKEALVLFMQHRARELLEFLLELVRDGNIPVADSEGNAGGLIIAGWSMGAAWMMALLAYAKLFPESAQLSKYVLRVALHDAPSFLYGFPRPKDPYNPYLETGELRKGEETRDVWVSGYYTHGDTLDTLERHHPQRDLPPTFTSMSREERKKTTSSAPGRQDGSDTYIVIHGHHVGLFSELRERALELSSPGAQEGGKVAEDDGEWRGVEVRIVWCDRSTWEAPHAAWSVAAELEEARKARRPMRNITVVRLRGGNHYSHWDAPEGTVRAIVAPARQVVDGVRARL